jgi:dolichol-phosphate hexosyltransferase
MKRIEPPIRYRSPINTVPQSATNRRAASAVMAVAQPGRQAALARRAREVRREAGCTSEIQARSSSARFPTRMGPRRLRASVAHSPSDQTSRGPSLGVIIPAYNEARTLELILRRVLQEECVQQVVIVDDCSTDGTFEIAQGLTGDPRVSAHRHATNRGKGAAVRTGLDAITAQIVIIQDADLEYDPADYQKLIAPIQGGRADVVYGVRGFAGQTAYSYWFVLGNRLVTTATNVLFNCYIQDMETGFKATRTSLLRRLRLSGNRFDIEPEITGRVLRLGYRIHEVPIDYYARSREEGKKLTWQDGVKALVKLLQIRLASKAWLFGTEDAYHRERLTQLSSASRLGFIQVEPPGDASAGTHDRAGDSVAEGVRAR